MVVIFRNVEVDLPNWLAELYLRAGVAHLPERSSLPTPIDYESRGGPTPRGRRPATASKPRKSSPASQKKATK
jgi:hypothetical protein